ncbi:MAG TPA: TRAP transporter substrate-binding protein DctP [Stellaceae bacterium]|nr:TRAP transporter substrate-binding protein DctP [Stellaceae bacterium]
MHSAKPLLALVMALGLGAAAANAADAPLTFKVSLDTSATHMRTISIADYIQQVETASGGTIKGQLFHSGQLHKDVDVPKAIREGNVDMAAPGIWVLAGFVPDCDIVQLPVFYGQPLEQQRAIMDGPVGQKINAQIEQKTGSKVLGPWLDLGFANFYSTKKPLNDFKDLEGLKIRTSGGAGQFARVKFFGGIGNMTPWPDVPLALSQGTFDALSTTNESAFSAKLWDSGLKYAFEDHQFMGYYIPIVSKTFWNKLSPEQQKLMVDVWAKNIPIYRQKMAAAQTAARQELIDHGLKFTVPTPEQIAAVRKKMMLEQDQIAKELKLTPEIVKEATEAMEKSSS